VAGAGGSDADDRLVERLAAHRAVEGGVAEGEDAAVGRHHPVAAPVRRGGHADDRLVEPDGARRAEEAGLPEGEDPAVGADQPVARGRRRKGGGTGRRDGADQARQPGEDRDTEADPDSPPALGGPTKETAHADASGTEG